MKSVKHLRTPDLYPEHIGKERLKMLTKVSTFVLRLNHSTWIPEAFKYDIRARCEVVKFKIRTEKLNSYSFYELI